MATNFKVYPWNSTIGYKKFDVVYEQAGVFRYHYATQDTVGQKPTAIFNFAVTNYVREHDATTMYYTYTGSGPRFAIGSIIRVTGMANDSFNFTGMAIDAGSGWVKYPDDGLAETTSVSVGAINCLNPAWTTGFMFIPSYTTSVDSTQNVIKASFGDGYSQRQRNGINSNLQSYKLVFNDRSDREAKAIFNFIEDYGGVDSVKLMLPINRFHNNDELKFTLKNPQMNTVYFDLNNLSVTADQVFDI